MKRTGWLPAALLAVAVLLAGCGRSKVAQVGGVLDEWRYHEPEMPATSVEPVEYVPMETPDFTELLGFRMMGMPSAEAYVPEKFFVLDGWYAQMEFRTGDERLLVVRVAATGAGSLVATYPEGHHQSGETLQAEGIEVTVRSDTAGCGMAAWQRDGYDFLLHSGKLYGPPPTADIQAMVKGLVARAA